MGKTYKEITPEETAVLWKLGARFEHKMYAKLPTFKGLEGWAWQKYDLNNTPPIEYSDDLYRVEVE